MVATIITFFLGITTSIIGSVILLMIQARQKKKEEKMLEAKCNIAGDYLTCFDDEIDGVHVESKARATLTQKGKIVLGESKVLYRDGIRTWVLSGELVEDRFLRGGFYSDDKKVHDIGSFFFEIGKDGLTGFWMGFDSDRKEIVCGRYSMKKLKDTRTIADYSDHYYPHIYTIAEQRLGAHYLDALLEALKSGDDSVFCKVAIVEGEVVGFGIGIIEETTDLINQLAISEVPKKQLRERLERIKTIGFFKSVAVTEKHEKQGIASALTEAIILEFRNRSIRNLMAFSWKRSSGPTSIGILKNYGFKELCVIPDFWTEDSIRREYSCPECGSPCHCSAIVFHKTLHADDSGTTWGQERSSVNPLVASPNKR